MTERIRPQRYGPERETLTAREAAAVLGIGINACYEAVRRGSIPHFKVGRKILIPRRALLRWLDAQADRTTQQPASGTFLRIG